MTRQIDSSLQRCPDAKKARWIRPAIYGALAAVTLVVTLALGASEKALEEKHWLSVRTVNFEIRSVLSRKRTVELANHLEAVRAAVPIVTNMQDVEPRIPLRIFALSGAGDFRQIGLPDQAVANFQPDIRESVIVLRNASDDEKWTATWAYAHFLLQKNSPHHLPAWIGSGMSSYLAATLVETEKNEVGGPIEKYLFALRRLDSIDTRPIVDAISENNVTETAQFLFRAKAWGLVHFLQSDPAFKPHFDQSMARYLELLDAGEERLSAFESGFDISIEELDMKLEQFYLQRTFPALRLAAGHFMPTTELQIARLTKEQVSLDLGQLASRNGKYNAARRWYEIAAKDPSLRASAESGIGVTWTHEGNYLTAQEHLDTAVDLAPKDLYCRLNLADYWLRRARGADATGDRESFAENALWNFELAWEIDHANAEMYVGYAATHLLGTPSAEHVRRAIEALKEAKYLLPWSQHTQLALEAAYLVQSGGEETRVDKNLVWAANGSFSDEFVQARNILTEIDSLPQ